MPSTPLVSTPLTDRGGGGRGDEAHAKPVPLLVPAEAAAEEEGRRGKGKRKAGVKEEAAEEEEEVA